VAPHELPARTNVYVIFIAVYTAHTQWRQKYWYMPTNRDRRTKEDCGSRLSVEFVSSCIDNDCYDVGRPSRFNALQLPPFLHVYSYCIITVVVTWCWLLLQTDTKNRHNFQCQANCSIFFRFQYSWRRVKHYGLYTSDTKITVLPFIARL